MNREIKTIKLSSCEVDIIQDLKWGEKEQLELTLAKGARVTESGLQDFDTTVLTEAKYKALEICIKAIRENDKVKEFSREWMDNLSVEDGDKLYKEVDNITNVTKKKDTKQNT